MYRFLSRPRPHLLGLLTGLFLLTIFPSCKKPLPHEDQTPHDASQITESDTTPHSPDAGFPAEIPADSAQAARADSAAALANRLIAQGLVDVQELAPAIQTNLKYATTDNFLGEDVYYGLDKAFLQPEVAQMLAKAQEKLTAIHPQLVLLIFDGVRPQSVQFRMWDLVKGTPEQDYVAEPNRGSLHNFGAAVDLGLIHLDSGVVDMGTPFDFFGDLAQPRYEGKYLQSGELTLAQVENRRLLRTVMNYAGFTGILNEWWHFNAFPKDEIRSRYAIVK